jgi:60 kDa SS-A/Ro ribonucleoprotein
MKTNKRAVNTRRTHEGGPASAINAKQELTRSVLACMLWERNFYESGEAIAERIARLVPQCPAEFVAQLAVEARSKYNLRHAPLYLCALLAMHHKGNLVGRTIVDVVQRADELSEFLAMYWAKGKTPISKQVKIGLGLAFRKFNEYQLAKYNRDNAIKLRDVMRLVHPRPLNKKQEKLWGRLLKDELETPDTWEVALSAGADKKATWERLLRENKLGYLALLRNLRNMHSAGVDDRLIRASLIDHTGKGRVLPFRYIAAARIMPQFEDTLDQAMCQSLDTHPPLTGHTVILVDHSGSMDAALSAKSDLTRFDAACALAVLTREICERVDVFTFNTKIAQVPPRRGMALRDAIANSMGWGGTALGAAIAEMPKCDRLIVITDEQANDRVGKPNAGDAYIINVASHQNGVGYDGNWHKLTGFSENVIHWIQEMESGPYYD